MISEEAEVAYRLGGSKCRRLNPNPDVPIPESSLHTPLWIPDSSVTGASLCVGVGGGHRRV